MLTSGAALARCLCWASVTHPVEKEQNRSYTLCGSLPSSKLPCWFHRDLGWHKTWGWCQRAGNKDCLRQHLSWRVTSEMPSSVPDRQVHFNFHVLKHQRFPAGSVEAWCPHKYQWQGSAKNDSPTTSFTRYPENFVLLDWNHIYSGSHLASGSYKSWGIHRFLGSLDCKELFVQKSAK